MTVSSTFTERLLQHAAVARAYIEQRIPSSMRGVIQADDVLQEAFISACVGATSFTDNGPTAFQRWLMAIVANRLADAKRAAGCAKRGGGKVVLKDPFQDSLADLFRHLVGTEDSPSGAAAAREAASAVRAALEAMREDRRTVIQLRFLEGCAVDVIAQRTGRTESAVRSLLRSACDELRERLGPASLYFSAVRSAETKAS